MSTLTPAPDSAPVIAIGGSAGAIEPLQALVAALPADFGAPVLVVVHIPAGAASRLPAILARSGPLPASHAQQGEAPEPGRIYVAPPDVHLELVAGRVRLSRSPRRNSVRPSVDVLFESLVDRAPATAAVVLSGALDDGATGALALVQAGGLLLVQDPAEALFPDMPANAARHAGDRTMLASPAVLAEALVAFASADHDPDTGGSMTDAPDEDGPEVPETEHAMTHPDGAVSPFTCPDCGGTLWERHGDGPLRWRCRVGHEYAEESMEAAQLGSLERALWAAVVALEERVDLSARLGQRFRRSGQEGVALRYDRQADAARDQIGTLRSAIVRLGDTGTGAAS